MTLKKLNFNKNGERHYTIGEISIIIAICLFAIGFCKNQESRTVKNEYEAKDLKRHTDSINITLSNKILTTSKKIDSVAKVELDSIHSVKKDNNKAHITIYNILSENNTDIKELQKRINGKFNTYGLNDEK
jgi:hypothetical protein